MKARPIEMCSNHLMEEFKVLMSYTSLSADLAARHMAVANEMDIRQCLYTGENPKPGFNNEFDHLMRTCVPCRQQAILYGGWKAKNLPTLIHKD